MKRIELNAALKFVLIVLTWLLTITVVNLNGTLNNNGAGLVGTLLIYVGLMYLAFGYFNDEDLQTHVKLSLVTLVIIIIANLIIGSYNTLINGIDNPNEVVVNIGKWLTIGFNIFKNITIAVFLLLSLIGTFTKKKENC